LGYHRMPLDDVSDTRKFVHLLWHNLWNWNGCWTFFELIIRWKRWHLFYLLHNFEVNMNSALLSIK
jgi:hypothetical protein